MRQPVNLIAPWGTATENGYVGIDDDGIVASQAKVEKLVFEDGSVQTTANSGGFSNPDMGTF